MERPEHSYSSLQTLAHCERKYALRYIDGLESDAPERLAYLRGNAFHAVLAADLLRRGAHQGTLLNRPETLKIASGLEIPIDWSDQREPMIPGFGEEAPTEFLEPNTVIGHLRVWESEQETERREAFEKEFGAPLADRLSNLWIRYQARWAEVNLAQAPLLVEYQSSRPAPNGKILRGRCDAVLYDSERNLVLVRDSKTHESWPTLQDAVMDLMDSQLHLEAWRLAPALRELSGGYHVPQAVEFDRVRFKMPTQPQLTTRGALSKSITDYDGFTYKQWCLEDPGVRVFDEAHYETKQDPDAWFRRSAKPLSMRAVEAHVKAAQAAAVRADGISSDTANLSPSKACGYCSFLSLCRSEIIGGRPEQFVPQDYGLRYRAVE